MLKQITGIERIQKLYIQLLYRCNFNCQHCFLGENLLLHDAYTLSELELMLNTFVKQYGATTVTYLGGEPFLYRELPAAVRLAKKLGLSVEICTNGYRIGKRLESVASDINLLRVSMEGLQEAHDQVRRPGSFHAALATLSLAMNLQISTSVTMTVNKLNIADVIPLAQVLQGYGVQSLKLHALRLVGNAKKHPGLVIEDPALLADLTANITKQLTPIPILLDEDLDPGCSIVGQGEARVAQELERIEIQPQGQLYVSCKAVGDNANAFIYDKETGHILYAPNDRDEIVTNRPQVRYSRIA